MKVMRNLTILITIVFLSGCATFVKHNIPKTKYIPKKIDPASKSEMSYSVVVHNPTYLSDWKITEAKVCRSVRDYFSKSGYFTRVRESKDPSDFHIDFEIIMNPNPSEFAYAYLAGCTLTLIPIWYTHDAELSATVYEFGRKSESFFAREEVTQAWWLPLMPISLFKNYMTAESEIKKNYFHDLLTQMEDKHLLPVRKHGLPPTIAEKPSTEAFDIDKDIKPISSGSGFFITNNGYLLTNYHVVDGAKKLRIKHNGKFFSAYLVAHDKVTDLALLKAEGSFDFIEISNSPAELGEKVFTTGYPNPDLQGSSIKYTEGNISSTAGFQDDARLYQISVPIQPGNSGGPLVKDNGKVVGMIVSKLSDLFALKKSGALPQNVNYAIKSTYLRAFLLGVNNLNLQPNESEDATAIQKAKSATAMILAY